MLNAGNALKVSIYVSDGTTRHGVPAYSAILDFLFYRGIAGATVFKGIAGFGADHHMHSSSSVEISDRLPLVIQFVESPEKAKALLGKLQELVGSGLIEVHETTVAHPAHASNAKEFLPPAHLKIAGRAKLMRIYVGESDRWRDKPLHEALVEAMRANDIAGVTVYRGILGYGAHRRVDHERAQHLSSDNSIILSVIDTAEKIESFLPLIDQMVHEGLVALSDVDIIKYAYRPAETQ